MKLESLLDHSSFVRDLAASLTFAHEDPDDVVQEAWLAALRSPPRGGHRVRGWLATVVRNALRQSRRSGARRAAREVRAGARRAIPTPDEIREREAVRREVVEAVLDLEEPYRNVVLLRYYEELPPREIAEWTGDPVETVKTRLARARSILRKRLDDRRNGDGWSWGFAVAALAFWPGEAELAPDSRRAWSWTGLAIPLVVAALLVGVGVTWLSSPAGERMPERTADVADETPPPEGAPDPDGTGRGPVENSGSPEQETAPTEAVVDPDRPRTGLRMRLVDESGKPLRRAGVRVITYRTVTVPPGEKNPGWSAGGLDVCRTDSAGEADLTRIRAALKPREPRGWAAIAFALEGEGIFLGSTILPNHEIPLEDIDRRTDRLVVLDVPVRPMREVVVFLVTPDGKAAAGVEIVGEPAMCFDGQNYRSDAAGRVVLRLRRSRASSRGEVREGPEPVLAAVSPWAGRASLLALATSRRSPHSPFRFEVQRERVLTLSIENDLGEPLARTEVELGKETATTDAVGRTRLVVAEGRQSMKIRAAGHLPEVVRLNAAVGSTVVRLYRSREVVVRFRRPEGGDGIVPIIARLEGSGRFFRVKKHDEKAKTLTMDLPKRRITISVHPTFTKYVGSVVAEPDAGEVELVLRTP